MKVLITFLFLGLCFFGLGSSEEIKPDIKMKNRITYEVTCNSTKPTQAIECCILEKMQDDGEFYPKKNWNARNEKCGNDRSDQYAAMVTNTKIVDKACQATFISNIDAEDHMGISL